MILAEMKETFMKCFWKDFNFPKLLPNITTQSVQVVSISFKELKVNLFLLKVSTRYACFLPVWYLLKQSFL